MESHGLPGCIQVTAATYQILRDKYLFQERGAISVKGKGKMTTYFLQSRRAHSTYPSKIEAPDATESRKILP